jgi:hypothetical protein
LEIAQNFAHETITSSKHAILVIPDLHFMALLPGSLKLKHFLQGKQPAPPTDKKAIFTHTGSLQIIYNAKI